MAHGFGDIAKKTTKILGQGAKDVGQFAKDEFGGALGSAYDSSMNGIKSWMQSRRDANESLFYKPLGKGEFGIGANSELKYQKFDGEDAFKTVGTGKVNQGSSTRSRGTYLKNKAKEFGKDMKWSAILSGGLYGLSAYASDDPNAEVGDRGINIAKHGVAAGVDLGADALLTGVATGLSMLGPLGGIAGGALTAFNMFAGFAGLDAGSLAMNAMNYTEQEYDRVKAGPKFNMTQNNSMAMQRQIQNLHASGSNLGEMMHN
jgi:hypothetical protein